MEKIAFKFKALSCENRLMIFSALIFHDELCVCDLKDFLNTSGATLSKHLKILKNANLINTVKRGKWKYCSIEKSELINSFIEIIKNEIDESFLIKLKNIKGRSLLC